MTATMPRAEIQPVTRIRKLLAGGALRQQISACIAAVGFLFLSAGKVSVAENVEPSSPPTRIVCPTDGSAMEILAAREVRRYWYLRTGDLLPIIPTLEQQSPRGGGFVVGRKDRAVLHEMGGTPAWNTTMAGLGPQQYLLRTIEQGGSRWLMIVGGDDVGTLYGAYRVAEHAGVRFYLHGDVVPDERRRAALPNLDEQGKPLFALRGINPFHDFPFGPDWWTTEDYKAIIAQLAKMRMNFIGFHCYAENGSHPAEPLVWIGQKGDFDDQGRVLRSYPSRLNHTMENPIPIGGFSVPMKTSDYRLGAAMLFDRDDAGSEAVAVAGARKDPIEAQNAMFNHCGTVFREAFGLARVLGVKTCVGTEVPDQQSNLHHVMPTAVVERLRAQGKDPADPAVVWEVYEAMFQRITKTHPLDYYWLWTPESWVRHFSGNSAEELKIALQHFNAAHEAIQRVGATFRLATAGWELGPQEDRAAYDRLLPKDVAVSSINPELGFDPVEPAFARIQGRDKWAIPWLEDDIVLMNPQLWVGRIRKDAAEALAYGCTGLLGIHCRTRILGPNLAALAEAGWSQTPWNPEPGKVPADSIGPRWEDSVDEARRPQPPLTIRLTKWPKVATPRGLRTTDFYADWAEANFGSEAASEVAALFERIDGNLPRTARGCPSGLAPDNRPWNQVVLEYGFVDDLQDCRKKMQGAGNLARFDYWLNWMRFLRATAHFQCTLGQYQQAMAKVQAEQDPARRKELARTLGLPAYREVFQQYVEASGLLLQMANTTDDLATVAVWQQTYYPLPLNKPVPPGATSTRTSALLGATFTSALGEPLPADVQPTQHNQGPPRLIVPTIRSTAVEGDQLPLRIIVLDRQPPRGVKLHWRTMGTGDYAKVDFQHVARGVHTVNLPPVSSTGIEYYVEAITGDGQQLVFPPTAPQLNQTIVALPQSARSSRLTSAAK